MSLRTAEDMRQLGTILGVWAHPDDESFVAGGVLVTAARHGQAVVCVTATRGEGGVRDAKRWPPERLGDIREAELGAALKILGVTQHSWLGYADGGLTGVDSDEAVARILQLAQDCRPDTIITFGPEGLTGHDDHRTVSAWAAAVARQLPRRPRVLHGVHTPQQYAHLKPYDQALNVYFNIDQPPLVEAPQCAVSYELPTDIWQLKRRAFAAMPSQMEALVQLLPEPQFRQAFGAEYLVEAEV